MGQARNRDNRLQASPIVYQKLGSWLKTRELNMRARINLSWGETGGRFLVVTTTHYASDFWTRPSSYEWNIPARFITS